MTLYFPISVRFLRTRLKNAEFNITKILPKGESDFQKAFGRVVSLKGQIAIILVIILGAAYVVIRSKTMVSLISNTFCVIYMAIMQGSLLWFTISCFFGLYKIGAPLSKDELGKDETAEKAIKKPIKFLSPTKDSRLGTRPIGTLCLTLSGAYFVGIILLVLLSAVSPIEMPKISYVIVCYSFLILLGITIFFLPLYRVHLRMVEEKNKQELQLIRKQNSDASDESQSNMAEQPLEKIQKQLDFLMKERKKELEESSIKSIHTWPFDTYLIGQFLFFLLSVAASLIASYVWSRIFQ
jgi:hypothetical protein